MWCLETIVALNDAAVKRAKKGESLRLAYKDVGIEAIRTTKPEEEKKKDKLKIA